MIVYNPNRLEWHQGAESCLMNPAGFCVVLSNSKRVFWTTFNRLAVALAKSQDHRASCGVFSFGIDPQGGLANGPCLGRTHIQMRLLTSQRVNLLEVSQEQGKLGDGRVADVNSALEIESSPYGCSSPNGWLKMGITRLGLSYCQTKTK